MIQSLLSVLFNSMQNLKFKSPLTVTFFSAINHNLNIHTSAINWPWKRNIKNGSKSTNHSKERDLLIPLNSNLFSETFDLFIQGWALIKFSYLQGGRLIKVGTYLRWALIQGWWLSQINTVNSMCFEIHFTCTCRWSDDDFTLLKSCIPTTCTFVLLFSLES